jgi:hypothetical protein
MNLDLEGDDEREPIGNNQTLSEDTLLNICDINNWVEGDLSLQRTNHKVTLSKIQLEALPDTTINLNSLYPESYTPTETRQYRPKLEFLVNGVFQNFTIYANPMFITAHPCVGTHVMMKSQAEWYGRNVVPAIRLRDYVWDGKGLLVINALNDGADALARAWCAEQGRHAVIRKGPGCCYRCAVSLTGNSGLGVKVLIWA